jgi:hypothetical protein
MSYHFQLSTANFRQYELIAASASSIYDSNSLSADCSQCFKFLFASFCLNLVSLGDWGLTAAFFLIGIDGFHRLGGFSSDQ